MISISSEQTKQKIMSIWRKFKSKLKEITVLRPQTTFTPTVLIIFNSLSYFLRIIWQSINYIKLSFHIIKSLIFKRPFCPLTRPFSNSQIDLCFPIHHQFLLRFRSARLLEWPFGPGYFMLRHFKFVPIDLSTVISQLFQTLKSHFPYLSRSAFFASLNRF